MEQQVITRSLRATKESFEEFIQLAKEEGRLQSKMFEILIEEYKKSKEENQ